MARRKYVRLNVIKWQVLIVICIAPILIRKTIIGVG